MDTYFAPAEKANDNDLAYEIELISNNPVLDGLLHSVSGLLAVLNEHRQLISINESFMQMLGLDNAKEALGLRPGEAVGCIHAHEEEGGCGTSKFCSTCGAAIAIVSAIKNNQPKEKKCALTIRKDNVERDIALQVRCQPINIDNKRFILLFLQDITREEQRAALANTFYHDIKNLLNGLIGGTELLINDDAYPELPTDLHKISLRLYTEIAIQACLSEDNETNYRPLLYSTTVSEVLNDLKSSFSNHRSAQDKIIEISNNCSELLINTDFSLLLRVLGNMVTNALESTEKNGTINISAEEENESVTFSVWNKQVIPDDIKLRIFQRNFSTKNEEGRGLGTFSMKLFGEKILGGRVSFTSNNEDGTTFQFTIAKNC